ncbi:hypothetical protein Efla_006594 [Eimeria flavescens]
MWGSRSRSSNRSTQATGGSRPSPPAGPLPNVRCFMLAFVAAVAAGGDAVAASGDGLLQGPLGVEEPLAAKEAAGVGSSTPHLAQLLQPQRRRQLSAFRLVPSLIAVFLSATVTLYLLSVCVKLLREERPTYRRLAGASGGDCGVPDEGTDEDRSAGSISGDEDVSRCSSPAAVTAAARPKSTYCVRFVLLACMQAGFIAGVATSAAWMLRDSLAAKTRKIRKGLEVDRLFSTDILAAKGVDIPDGLEVDRLFPTDMLAATTLDFPDGLEVHLLIPT